MCQNLELPFAPVNDAEIAFGGIPNMEAAIAACPQSFQQGGGKDARAYQTLANDLFAHFAGWRSMTEAQLSEMKAATDMERYSEAKWRYIQCWLKSFAPSHQDKEAVVAWCLSLIMKHPPSYLVR